MLKHMSHSFVCAFAFAAVFPAAAEEISLETAGEAAQSWIDGGYSLGKMRGRRMASGKTVEADGAKIHVVRFEGGGFVAMGADDLVDPVIAFSPSGSIDAADEASPLLSILRADLASRMRAAARQESPSIPSKSGRLLLGAAAASSARTESQKRWDRLLGRSSGPALLKAATTSSQTTRKTIPDVRVEPLVKSRWGQGNNSHYKGGGDICFNYYTPSHYDCGCVATAMAQIMRYHRYPASGPVGVTRTCGVGANKSTRSFTTMGGIYQYDSMPLVPEAYEGAPWYAGGATDDQRKAIGKLTYDCGVVMQMWWADQGSSCGGWAAGEKMVESFSYGNARVNTCTNDLRNAELRNRMICASLDAGMPVMIGMLGQDGGREVQHQLIADGYGYSDGTLFTHLNMGWADACDVWYALPEIRPSEGGFSSSDSIKAVIYNLFPTQSGEIVSGRVLTEQGYPYPGVKVSIRRNDNTAALTNMVTNARGVFAFIVPSNTQYTVWTQFGSNYIASTNVETRTSDSSEQESFNTESWTWTYNETVSRQCGNVWGCDLVLPVPTVERPVIEPGSNPDGSACEFRRSTNVVITCATSGATIRYTTDGSDPTSMSPAYRAPVTIEHHTVLKARAFKTGFNPSPVATAEYFDPLEGDLYEQPILISGTNGVHTIADNSKFGIESGEPYITSYEENYSCWYRWKSPGTGEMTFKLAQGPYSAIAFYEDAPSIYELQISRRVTNMSYFNGEAFSYVKVNVKAGRVYRIVGLQWFYFVAGTVTLSWEAEPGFVIPPPPLTVRLR